MFPVGRPVKGQQPYKLNEENTKTRVLTCIQKRDVPCHLNRVSVVRSARVVQHQHPSADPCQTGEHLLPAGGQQAGTNFGQQAGAHLLPAGGQQAGGGLQTALQALKIPGRLLNQLHMFLSKVLSQTRS